MYQASIADKQADASGLVFVTVAFVDDAGSLPTFGRRLLASDKLPEQIAAEIKTMTALQAQAEAISTGTVTLPAPVAVDDEMIQWNKDVSTMYALDRLCESLAKYVDPASVAPLDAAKECAAKVNAGWKKAYVLAARY